MTEEEKLKAEEVEKIKAETYAKAVKDAEDSARQVAAQKEAEDMRAADDIVSNANEAAERLEKANEDMDKNLARQERLTVEKRLGGTADAGKPTQTEDEKAIEAATKLTEGTGLNPFAKSLAEPKEK